jgi:hypothetical protein
MNALSWSIIARTLYLIAILLMHLCARQIWLCHKPGCCYDEAVLLCASFWGWIPALPCAGLHCIESCFWRNLLFYVPCVSIMTLIHCVQVPFRDVLMVMDCDHLVEPEFFAKACAVMLDRDVAVCLIPQSFHNEVQPDCFDNTNYNFMFRLMPYYFGAGCCFVTGARSIPLWHCQHCTTT